MVPTSGRPSTVRAIIVIKAIAEFYFYFARDNLILENKKPPLQQPALIESSEFVVENVPLFFEFKATVKLKTRQ